MKSIRIGHQPRNESVFPNYASWNKGTQVGMLRVELADGGFYLFPYCQLSFVKFDQNAENDVLHVRFARHEVQITGKHLRPLGLALQKLAVDWIRRLPERYARTVTTDVVFINGIKVTEIEALQPTV
ncbi:MAG TPA: hypothetical protein VL171_10725 [Verrucomicrobiae bacterium]|nr:hypothetical protein [Verrucomicrobiae bacterium]